MRSFSKLIIATLGFVSIALTVNAQKEPQIQKISVRAPENIRIDGKLDEWSNPFVNEHNPEAYLNAFNSANRLYYVIANDDDNLYLTVRGLGTGAATKILSGGMVITISHAVERKAREKAKDNMSITFPIGMDSKSVSYIMGPVRSLSNFLLKDQMANRKIIDSLVSLGNARLSGTLKEIKIIGVNAIADTVISIYNENGIKAAAQFIKRMPVIELAIPLKYLGLSVDSPVSFSYNIKLPGRPPVYDLNMDPRMADIEVDVNPDLMYMQNPTDFWGEYILAKKP